MDNRLATETSPYLRQHATNPVDWWPWCEAAFDTARRERKPVLLSIGYAACHWCHVMAHESFEDDATARVMNELFVNIKVDREERPDLDKVYQLAHQALARRGGGWPLTMFLTADDRLPFFAGTYFPKSPRHRLPSFTQVLHGVRRWHDEKPDDMRAQNASLARFLAEQDADDAHDDTLDATPLAHALERIAANFDADNGGHLGAPKFPHAGEIELLLRQRHDIRSGGADAMGRLTLERIAARGLDDHVGGGFFRYCVDAEWRIPHFEKMLYDNAQLLPLLAVAGARFDHAGLAQAARDCAHWLTHDMLAPGGGFFSSLDADSEGEEGRYYVWQREEIRAPLDADEYAVAEHRFGLDQPPNFEQHAWHLCEVATFDEIAAALGITSDTAQSRWRSARAKLAIARAQRPRPALDDKILTAWNALLIGGAARALRAQADLGELREPIESALDFLHENLWRDGRLYASHARGETKLPAYLDDHAFLLDALLAMLQRRWNRRDLDWAIALADVLLDRFEDRERGGFWFTAHDAEPLPQRPKSWMDESLPSGNGVAARALLALGHLLGDTRYLDAAERTLRAAWPTLAAFPHACCTLLLALDEFLHPRTRIVLRADAADATRWHESLATWANADIYRIPSDAGSLPGILSAQAHHAGGTAWICHGTHCLPPVFDPPGLSGADAPRSGTVD